MNETQIDTQNKNSDDSFGEDWDGNEIFRCQDLIYKFTICNSTSTPICYKIKLIEKAIQANLKWPRSGIKG